MPLQEAMHFGLPVVAYDAGAVRETLHGGGLLLQDKQPELVAELLDRVTHGGRCAARSSRARPVRSPASARPTSARCCASGCAGGAPGSWTLASASGAGRGTCPRTDVGGSLKALSTDQSFGIAPARLPMAMTPSLRRIDQWVPALHRGDAIGDSARLMRDAFRSWGYEADVWAPDVDEISPGEGRPYAEFAAARGGPGRRRHPPLRAALAAHRRPARPSPAGACCCTTTSRPRSSSPAGTPSWRGICALGSEQVGGPAGPTSTSPSPTASSAGGSSRRWASRAPASCRSTSTSRATASRRTRCSSASSTTGAPTSSSSGRVAAEQEARGPRPPRLVLEALRLPGRAAGAGRPLPAPRDRARPSPAAPLPRRAPGLRLRGGPDARRRCLHRPPRPRRPARLLRRCRRVRLHERARGLRRAARRGDAHGRAGARAAARRRCRFTLGEGGRHVRRQRPRRSGRDGRAS